MPKDTLKEAIAQKLRINCGCTPRQAGDGDMLRACAMVLRDIMAERNITTREDTVARQLRQVHYAAETPQPAAHQPDEGEGTHGVSHIFFVPLELRHRQGRKHRKGHRDGLQHSHSSSPPL